MLLLEHQARPDVGDVDAARVGPTLSVRFVLQTDGHPPARGSRQGDRRDVFQDVENLRLVAAVEERFGFGLEIPERGLRVGKVQAVQQIPPAPLLPGKVEELESQADLELGILRIDPHQEVDGLVPREPIQDSSFEGLCLGGRLGRDGAGHAPAPSHGEHHGRDVQAYGLQRNRPLHRCRNSQRVQGAHEAAGGTAAISAPGSRLAMSPSMRIPPATSR